MVFWCMFGGVRGASFEDKDDDRDDNGDVGEGVDAADMIGDVEVDVFPDRCLNLV